MRFDPLLTAPVVIAVRAGSAAARAGVRAGDRVVAVDGTSVAALAPTAVEWWIGDREQGARVTVTLVRGAQSLTMPLAVEPPWD